MVEDILVKKIIDPCPSEKQINTVELKMYSKLINQKKANNDNSDFVRDLFNQLMDVKEINTKSN